VHVNVWGLWLYPKRLQVFSNGRDRETSARSRFPARGRLIEKAMDSLRDQTSTTATRLRSLLDSCLVADPQARPCSSKVLDELLDMSWLEASATARMRKLTLFRNP
jgi:hypothetical protein